ncbi:hypothetical protein TgHK011_000304 [Trichoderma gracile]|nr:hypothetical protein TgHK011_000304 [Trichoderma gracile]
MDTQLPPPLAFVVGRPTDLTACCLQLSPLHKPIFPLASKPCHIPLSVPPTVFDLGAPQHRALLHADGSLMALAASLSGEAIPEAPVTRAATAPPAVLRCAVPFWMYRTVGGGGTAAALAAKGNTYSGMRVMLCEPTIACAHEARECVCVLNGQFEWGTAQTVIPTRGARHPMEGKKRARPTVWWSEADLDLSQVVRRQAPAI